MEIKRIRTQASGKGPADWFTGAVRIGPLFPLLKSQETFRFTQVVPS